MRNNGSLLEGLAREEIRHLFGEMFKIFLVSNFFIWHFEDGTDCCSYRVLNEVVVRELHGLFRVVEQNIQIIGQ